MLARSTMKRKRFTGEQIISISRERETGIAVPDLDLDKQMLEDVIKHQKTLSQSCAPMVPMAQWRLPAAVSRGGCCGRRRAAVQARLF